MKFLKYHLILLISLFLIACGGGGSSNSNNGGASGSSDEDISFTEKENGNLEIEWNKNEATYKVLALEKNTASRSPELANRVNRIKLYSTSTTGHFILVCRPDDLGSSTVTYDCSIKKNGTSIGSISFVLYATEGRYVFVLGEGRSFEDAVYQRLADQISTAGLDIDIRYGEYQLLDRYRTYEQYHGYFLLLRNNLAKSREFANGEMFEDEFVWSYNRNSKEIILDNTENGGGYAEGTVYGNNKKFYLKGYWNNGTELTATLTYMSNSQVFTRDSRPAESAQLPYQDSGVSMFSGNKAK